MNFPENVYQMSFVLKIFLRNEPNELPGCSTPRTDTSRATPWKSMNEMEFVE